VATIALTWRTAASGVWNFAANSSFLQTPTQKGHPMVIGVAHIAPIVALIAGVLILLMPRLLNLIVAIYLIFIGLVGLGVLSKLGIH
jgi:hypothetical protein